MYITAKREDLLRATDRRRSLYTKLEALDKRVLVTRRFGAEPRVVDALVTVANNSVVVVRTDRFRAALQQCRPNSVVSLYVTGTVLVVWGSDKTSLRILGADFPPKEALDEQGYFADGGVERRSEPSTNDGVSRVSA